MEIKFCSVVCVLLLDWSPPCPTVQFHMHSSLSCIYFSHSSSHTYRFVHFQSCKTDIPSTYITHIKWWMWQGQMRERRKISLSYHISILSLGITEKHERLTRVAWSCVCWLFFGRLSPFTMLHNLIAPLPAWHQPVHLFVCLPPGSSLHLPTAST